MEWQVPTAADMRLVARDILAQCTPHSHATVIALHGDLGAGKTTFVQALAAELAVPHTVTSPTFVIMKQYETAPPWDSLVHIDAYRIEDVSELVPLHFSQVLTLPNVLVCIEWAERIASVLPANTLHVTISLTDTERTVTTAHVQA